MSEILILFFTVVLTENYSLTRFFAFFNIDRERSSTKKLASFGVLLTIILTISAMIIWPIYQVLSFVDAEYLYIFVSVVVIIFVTNVVNIVISTKFRKFYRTIADSLPIVTINSTILGAILISIDRNQTFFQTAISGFAAGVGYMLAVMIFQGINFRIKDSEIPPIFKGVPILLISASIAAMAFEGFAGIITNIF